LRPLILAAALALGGCAAMPAAPPSSLKPVCAALIGPIRYNTFDAKSRRHAGDLLARDLKARNAVGRRLGCPRYR